MSFRGKAASRASSDGDFSDESLSGIRLGEEGFVSCNGSRNTLWHMLTLLGELAAYVCLLLAWSGNGRNRTYLDVHGFSFGGLGFCKYGNCQRHLVLAIPEEFLKEVKSKIWPSIFHSTLWVYLIAACQGSLLFLALCYYGLRKSSENLKYHKLRLLHLLWITFICAMTWVVSMVCALIADADLKMGYTLTIISLVLLCFSTLGQFRTFWYYRSKATGRERKSHSWENLVSTLQDYLGIILASQSWSCLAGGFFITVNVMIMIHDFNSESVQKYIKEQITPMFAGFSDFADTHPTYYGVNKTCSHFPVSNIAAQGENVEPIAMFFIYHISLCIISFLLIIDESCDARFGILGPQQNKTGASWTCFYLFTATMSRSIVFWNRGSVQLVNGTAWAILSIACIHIVLCNWKVKSWKGTSSLVSVYPDYRHASLRTGKRRAIGEADPDMRVPAKRRVTTGDDEDELEAEELEDLPQRQSRITEALGVQPGDIHSTSDYTGFIKHNEGCYACRVRRCQLVKRAFFRGIPMHRGNDYRWWLYLMDMRRLLCILSGLLLFLIHFTLCFSELAPSVRSQFQTEYLLKKKGWAAQQQQAETEGVKLYWRTPLLPSECSYFDYSSIPVTYIGNSDLNSAVLLSMAVVGLHKTFLMGMCCSVILVSVTNNRYWGQSIRLGVFSLLGPRLSSISVGITLIHVSLSTLSQSLFADNVDLYRVARICSYFALTVGALSCICTEDLSGRRKRLTSKSGWFKTLFKQLKQRKISKLQAELGEFQ